LATKELLGYLGNILMYQRENCAMIGVLEVGTETELHSACPMPMYPIAIDT